ncbi:MAG TPA: ATPase domain-containing protein [Alphaproteobacteria bacterium]|nr:ATPase domain-containing protein [Alphaproteobacteria bacterium]
MDRIISKQGDIKRVPLYIQGLDEVMEGGIPEGHITLVCGSAGTMKSSVCFNSIYNECSAKGKISIYFTLEQSYASLLNHTINMGYDLSKVNVLLINDLSNISSNLTQLKGNKKGTVIFADLGCIRKEIKDAKVATTQNAGWMNVLKNLIKKVKTELGLDMVVIDSLSALYVLSKFENPRIELFYVFEFLREMNITSYLISETPLDGSRYSEYGVEDFLCDGIIYIRLSPFRRAVVREVSIVKMRSTQVKTDIFSLEFKGGKFYALYGGQNPLL